MPTPAEAHAVTDFVAGLIYGSFKDGFNGLVKMATLPEPTCDEQGTWGLDVETAGGTRMTVSVGLTAAKR